MEKNPYHPLLPPDDPTLFYGREDAIAFLHQHLVGAHSTELLLILGRTGMGKTALLHQIDYVVDERYQAVYINLEDVRPTSPRGLILHWVGRIVGMMERIEASTYRLPPTPPPDTPEAELREWFKSDFLDVAITAIRRDRFLLLLLDNLDRLLSGIEAQTLPADFIAYLGELLAAHERLDMVGTLNTAQESHLLQHAPFSNLGRQFRLRPLDAAATRRLILEPVQDRYSYTNDALNRILLLCGGHPFLVHSLCRLLYRYHEGNPTLVQLSFSTINVVHEAAVQETGEILRDYWDNAPPATQQALSILVEAWKSDPLQTVDLTTLSAGLRESGIVLSKTQLAATLRTLEYDDLISSALEGGYRLCTGLEAAWLAEHPIEIPAPIPRFPNKTRAVGLVAVVVAVLLVGAFLALGAMNGEDDAAPLEDAPPTATLEIDFDATRRAEVTPTPSRTPRPSATPQDD